MGTNDIKLRMFNKPEEAPVYSRPVYKGASLEEAIVVRNGTTGGKATVDLIFVDETGQKYVTMITESLLNAVRIAAGGAP